MNPALLNASRQTQGQPVKQGILGSAFGKVTNFALMTVPLVGMFVGKPFQFFYEKTGWKGFSAISKIGQADRVLKNTSISDVVGRSTELVQEHAPQFASGFASVGGKIGEVTSKVSAKPGFIASAIEKVANIFGGKKVYGFYQGLNHSAADAPHGALLSHVEGMLETLQGAKGAEAQAITSELNALRGNILSKDAVHKGGEALRDQMSGILNKIGEARGAVSATDSGIWNTVHREASSAKNELGNVLNKMAKANFSGIGEHLSSLPARLGKLSFHQLALTGANVAYTGSQVAGNVKDTKDNIGNLRKTYEQMTGKTATDKQLLFGKDMPQEIVAMRKSMRSALGNAGMNIATLGASQVAVMKGGRGFMIGMMIQMLGSTVGNWLMPKSESLGTAAAINGALENKQAVPATTYIDLLATVSESTKKQGVYGPQKMRSDYLALYAESKQMNPGELLQLASKAGNDATVATQISGEVEALLAEKKAAVAKEKFEAQELNPEAKAGHVKKLETDRGKVLELNPQQQARA